MNDPIQNMYDAAFDEPLTVNEAFDQLREIRRRCPDIQFKVITTDDVYSTLGLDEIDYEPEVEEALRERIRNSWEMKHWCDMFDDDWSFFEMMDGIPETLAQFDRQPPLR